MFMPSSCEGQKRHRTPWNCSYRQLSVTVWMPGSWAAVLLPAELSVAPVDFISYNYLQSLTLLLSWVLVFESKLLSLLHNHAFISLLRQFPSIEPSFPVMIKSRYTKLPPFYEVTCHLWAVSWFYEYIYHLCPLVSCELILWVCIPSLSHEQIIWIIWSGV